MNELHGLRQRALALLTRREHSRAELVARLASHGIREEIETVLAGLEKQGLLSDARFAEGYVRSNAARLGVTRLRQTLAARGIAGELIETQVAELPDEADRVRAVWTKKFGTAPADAREWAKQARFLQGRGFSAEAIHKLLKETDE
ncbi:MAG: recombination regulator RecX [Rhodocyclaceae bacterium]|nr:recombination regulator RecX [Rhodocyclaceae bacterium]